MIMLLVVSEMLICIVATDSTLHVQCSESAVQVLQKHARKGR